MSATKAVPILKPKARKWTKQISQLPKFFKANPTEVKQEKYSCLPTGKKDSSSPWRNNSGIYGAAK